MIDDGLPLLRQQRNELPLGVDVAPNAPVHPVHVADDGALLGEGREGTLNRLDARVGKAVPRHAIRSHVKLIGNRLALQNPGQI